MTIRFFNAGTGETGYPLYSEVTLTGTLFPWVGKAEAYKIAKGRDTKALFYKTEDEARAAMKKASLRRTDVTKL